MRGACEEDAAEREKRAAMYVMFVATVAMLTIVKPLFIRRALFGVRARRPRHVVSRLHCRSRAFLGIQSLSVAQFPHIRGAHDVAEARA